jgi:hypothetical protein
VKRFLGIRPKERSDIKKPDPGQWGKMGRELPSEGALYFAQRHRRGRKQSEMATLSVIQYCFKDKRKIMKKTEKGSSFQCDNV